MGILIHFHVPGDAPNLDSVLHELVRKNDNVTVHRDGDSYREWDEPLSAAENDTDHVIVEVPLDHAEMTWHYLGQKGVPVDATLADDHTASITWGLGGRYPGWVERFRPEMIK